MEPPILHVRTTVSMLPVAILMLILTPTAAAGQSFPPIPDRAPGTVTLPVTEYDRLVDRAASQPAQPLQPPIPAVVARAELAGRVDADVARGTVRLEGEVFQRGSVKVPLVSSSTLIDARSDGRVLPLVQEAEVHSAILNGPAPFAVVLEWTASIELTPGRASVVLPQAVSGTGTATLDLPGEAVDVRVEAGLITEQQTSNRRTVVRLTLTPGSRTRVSWSVRENAGQATPVEVRTPGEIKSLVTIGDGDLRLSSLVDVVIVRGEPRAFEVQLHAGYTLASVSGGTLDRYDVKGDTVQLTVREPERRRHQFVLTMEQPHGPLATVDIPVTLLEWEVFLPGQFSAKPIAGNVMPMGRVGLAASPAPAPSSMAQASTTTEAAAGEIIGRVFDGAGSVLPGVTIGLSSGGQRRTVVTDPSGLYRLSAVPAGPVTVTSELAGFSTGAHSLVFDGAPRRIDFRIAVSGLSETVQVVSEATGMRNNRLDARADEVQQAPSENVVNMQRRVAGVLPVRIDMPRAGTSYRFVRPLVLDEQTTVSLRYKRR